MTSPTMLLKPLTSSLNIGTKPDTALILLKVLTLWLWCLCSSTISSDLIVRFLILHLLRLLAWNTQNGNKILCYSYPDFRLTNIQMVALWFVIGRASARSFLPLTNCSRAFTSFQAKICDILWNYYAILSFLLYTTNNYGPKTGIEPVLPTLRVIISP